MKISYSAAVCGSGKTHQIVNRACKIAKAGNNVLIVQPTKQLIDRTVEAELINRPNPPRYEVFHGDKFPGAVTKELMHWLKTFDSEGGWVVFITHQLLPHIPYFPDKGGWHVFIDEAPQAHDRHTLQIPHSHSILTAHLTLVPYNGIYSRLVCDNAKAITDIARNKQNDAVFEVLSEAARDVKNRNWDCYVNTEWFERLRRGEANKLNIYTVLSPTILSGFRSVLVAAANFKDTALYQLWGRRGVWFEEDKAFSRSLRFDQHSSGELIKIYYAVDERWSRAQQRKSWVECGNLTTLQLMAQSAVNLVGDRPFVWQTNKGDADALRSLFVGGRELPHLAHGLNDYSAIDNIVLLTASNPTPHQYQFLRNQGMDGNDVRRAVYFQNAYQTVLRTSIRDPENTEPKLIIVPDLPLAEHLQQLFSGSRVERMETGIPANSNRQARVGRPRKHRTDKERKARYRQRRKLELIRSKLLLPVGDRPYVGGERLCVSKVGDEKPIESLLEFRPLGSNQFGTVFASKYATTGLHMACTRFG